MIFDYTLAPVTLQQIQVFLCTARTQNFTHAAAELNMTQPGVSKSIATLESILGFSLFEKRGRHVKLTKQGLTLCEQWEHLLSDIQTGYQEAVRMAQTDASELNIGVVSTADSEKYFWPTANQFRKQYPQVTLNVESEDMLHLRSRLTDGTYDIVFLPDFEHYSLDQMHIPWKYAAKANVQIIVPKNSTLSEKKILTIEDILNAPVTALDPKMNPNFQLSVEELYSSHGKKPVYSGFYRSNFQIRYIQMTQNCIHITDDFWSYTPDDFSKKIPLKNHFNGIICAWNPTIQKPCLKHFLKLIPSLDEKV